MFRVFIDTSPLRRRLQEESRRHDHDVERVLHLVGRRTVELLQSYTGETTPTGRKLHPGGWADRTGETKESFSYEVDRRGSAVQLIISNDAEHAVELEEHDGIYLVRGIAERGGPVWELFVQAAKENGLQWRFS